MRAELNTIEGMALRLRRDHRRLHLRVTLLLVYVTAILLWAASCAPFERPEAHCVASPALVSVYGEAKGIESGPVRALPDLGVAGPARQAPVSASRPGVARAHTPAGRSSSAAPDNTLRFTLPGGGSLSMSVPVNLSEADAVFAGQVVGDYLTSLAWRGSPQQ